MHNNYWTVGKLCKISQSLCNVEAQKLHSLNFFQIVGLVNIHKGTSDNKIGEIVISSSLELYWCPLVCHGRFKTMSFEIETFWNLDIHGVSVIFSDFWTSRFETSRNRLGTKCIGSETSRFYPAWFQNARKHHFRKHSTEQWKLIHSSWPMVSTLLLSLFFTIVTYWNIAA